MPFDELHSLSADELSKELISRGDRGIVEIPELAKEALWLLERGRIDEAKTTLERALYPAHSSAGACYEVYRRAVSCPSRR